jgi:hypothetical protein
LRDAQLAHHRYHGADAGVARTGNGNRDGIRAGSEVVEAIVGLTHEYERKAA